MVDLSKQQQAYRITNLVMQHTQEVDDLIALFKQQAQSLDRLTELMMRLTRALENVSSQFAEPPDTIQTDYTPRPHAQFPFFMTRRSDSTDGELAR